MCRKVRICAEKAGAVQKSPASNRPKKASKPNGGLFCFTIPLKDTSFLPALQAVTFGYMLLTEQTLSTYRQRPNIGQVARLKLLPIADVLAITPPGEGPAVADPLTVSKYGLAVAAGATLTELVFPPGGCTFTEATSTDAAGTVWAPELTATIPQNQPLLVDWLAKNKTRRWLAIWLDRNGQAYLAGEPGNGLRMGISRAIAGGNSVAVSLKGRSWHPTYFLETFDSSVLFAYVDFDLSFDFSFNA